MHKTLTTAVLLTALGVAAPAANAFCGFYVNGAGGDMFNDATQVVLMRMGPARCWRCRTTTRGRPRRSRW
jgi:hypothetical protein